MKNKTSHATVAGFAAAAVFLVNGCQQYAPDPEASKSYADQGLANSHVEKPKGLAVRSEAGATYMYWSQTAEYLKVCAEVPPTVNARPTATNVVEAEVLQKINALPTTHVDADAVIAIRKIVTLPAETEKVWNDAAMNAGTGTSGSDPYEAMGSAIGNAVAESATAYQKAKEQKAAVNADLRQTRDTLSQKYGRNYPVIDLSKDACIPF